MSVLFHPGDQVLARHQQCADLVQRQIDWLRNQGVPPSAFHRHDVIVAADVLFNGLRFEFADEAAGGAEPTPALIFMAYDEEGLPADLVAWSPRSNAIATWLSRVGNLGDALGPRIDEHGGLVVHPDPLAWLRANRDGVVIVDPDLATEQLRDAGPFVVDADAAFGLALREMLTPRSPEIFVLEKKEAA